MWKHIIGPDDRPQRDTRLWATGNGWAASGLVRVLATATHANSILANIESKGLIAELFEITSDLIEGAMASATNGSPPLLCNYLDDDSYFGDVAGTALIAASVFRLAKMAPEKQSKRQLDWAEQAWKNIQEVIAGRGGDVGPTPMPGVATSRVPSQTGSSQGHSFVVMCFAAQRDWSEQHGGNAPCLSWVSYWRIPTRQRLEAVLGWLWS